MFLWKTLRKVELSAGVVTVDSRYSGLTFFFYGGQLEGKIKTMGESWVTSEVGGGD